MDERDWLAGRFEEHRTALRAVAYRMLGSLSEADDAVQEAWLRLSRTDASEIENLGAWLTDRRRARVAQHAACAPDPCRGVARAGADRRPRGGDRPRARGLAGGRRRPGAARRARDAVAARAARVRAARHVRRPVRRDRADRRPLARGGTPARQPRAAPHPRHHSGRRSERPARGRRRLPRGGTRR